VQSRPIASLVVVELESGTMRKIASGVDYLQPPVWTRDGAGVVVSRSAATGPLASVSLARAMTDGSGEAELATAAGVLGAYPVGFDSAGRFLHVVIDGRGSTLYRDGGELALLSDGITRDWRLDGDATALAYIETRTDGGLKYLGRAIELDGAVAAHGAADAGAGESLGVAWRVGDARPIFGREPGGAGAVAAQGTASIGFDVPLLYSADGQALAVQRWTGRSFDEPGEGSLELVQSGGGRISLDGYARFFGWAVK
jgi:hypothetical protein